MPPDTWSPERVLQALREWARATGRPPRAEEWSVPSTATRRDRSATSRWSSESPPWPCPTTVRRYFGSCRYFGSWSAALEEAGLRPTRLGPWQLSLPERVEAARQLSARRVPVREIALQLAVSPSTVRKYLRASTCPCCYGPLVSIGASRCHDCEARGRAATMPPGRIAEARRACHDDRIAVVAALRELTARNGRRPT